MLLSSYYPMASILVLVDSRGLESPGSWGRKVPNAFQDGLMPRLTKRRIDALPARQKEYFVSDDTLKGFGARVYPNGG